MSINICILPILSMTVIKILRINVSGFLKYRKCKMNLDTMHYREANVNFLVLKQGMEGLERGDAAPCPLCIFPFFSLQQ